MLDLKSLFKDYAEKTGPEALCIEMGLPIDEVKKLIKKPTIDAISWYVEKVYSRQKSAEIVPQEPSASWKQAHNFEWEGRRLSVLFPSYKFTNAATAWTLAALALDLGKEKARFDMELGDAVVANARNKLASRFMDSGCEWSLWIDDDMIVPIGRAGWFKMIGRLPTNFPEEIAGRHVVTRLLSHGKTIVGGCYWGRQRTGKPMFGVGQGGIETRDAAKTMAPAIFEVPWVATGCMLVHRKVFEDIQKKFPNLAPTDRRKEWDFFRMENNWGEDVSFCMRAKEAGHASFVDTGCVALHVGFQAWGPHNAGETE